MKLFLNFILMKYLILFLPVLLTSINSFAQRRVSANCTSAQSPSDRISGHSHERITGVGDTTTMTNINFGDPLTIYYCGSGEAADSGYATGTNAYNDLAFAERYDFNSADSNLVVIGLIGAFAGKVSSYSNTKLTFDVWNVGQPVNLSVTKSFSGFPDSVIDSVQVSAGSLFITMPPISERLFLFPKPVGPLSAPFFAGYTIYYNFQNLVSDSSGGDTIGLMSTQNGHRVKPPFTITGVRYDTMAFLDSDFMIDTITDTEINVQNATMWSDGNWHDNYTQNDSLLNDLAIFPVVVSTFPSDVQGITKNDLTVFGCYPNPARDETSLRFSLMGGGNASVIVMDLTGRILRKSDFLNLPAGDQSLQLDTQGLTPGDYVCLIKVPSGAGFGVKFSRH